MSIGGRVQEIRLDKFTHAHQNRKTWLTSPAYSSKSDGDVTPSCEDIITDITGRRNVRIQNPYTCTTSSGVMRFSYDDRAVLDGRFRHHLFQAVFMQTTYPSRYVYFRWSRVHTAVETAVTAPVGV